MKNIKFLIFIIGLLFIGILSGCSSDEKNYPVAIGFSNKSAADTVPSGSDYVLSGTIVADGPIKTVKFYRNFVLSYEKDSVEVTKQDSVEMAATQITNIKGDSCSFSISVPDITENTTVRVVAIQSDGHQTSAVYTISLSNVTFQLNKWCGGWDSPLYGNFYSVANSSSYGQHIEWTDPSLILQCDFYFGDYDVGATDMDYPLNDSSPAFSDMGCRFAQTKFTSAQFYAMKSDALFKSLATPTLSSVNIAAGNVILFKTKAGKLGLLHIISTNGEEDYNFDVLVQN
jgi:hypothetical protein